MGMLEKKKKIRHIHTPKTTQPGKKRKKNTPVVQKYPTREPKKQIWLRLKNKFVKSFFIFFQKSFFLF